MASTSRRDRAPLSVELFQQAYRFDFFQAVRLLELMAREEASGDSAGQRHPVGHDHSPRQEVIRFRALPSHSFPTGSISEIRRRDPRGKQNDRTGPPEMTTPFMGLTGPNGVLPRHYTSLLIERIRLKDHALRDFLDLFHHRVISLFYRAWDKYRFPTAYERAQREDREDLFTHCLYCLLGLGTGGLSGRMRFDDEALLYYAGYFAHRPRSAITLEILLGDYYELPVQLSQFHGQWLHLSRDDQSSLPCPQWPRGLNTRLGKNVVIGERVWDVQSKFRVAIGPLGYGEFCRFVPSGGELLPLCQLIRTYVGPQFDFDVQLVLKADEVPWCRLGGDGADCSRLGWNTWIRSHPFEHDVHDAIFSLEGLP